MKSEPYQTKPDTCIPKLKAIMLKQMQDHRNVDALFLAVSLAANLRVARRVQYRTSMRKAPDKTRHVTNRLSKCLIVRTRHRPTTNAPSAAQQASAKSFQVVELIFMHPTPPFWFRKTLYNIHSEGALQVQSGRSQQNDRVNP